MPAEDPKAVIRRWVEAWNAEDLDAAEGRAQPTERVGVAVDHGDRVAAVLQAPGQGAADPAASHDHDVHVRTLHRSVIASAQPRPPMT